MRRNKISGFTVLELLVVIAIIGILASIVLASLNSSREKGQIAKAQSDVNSLYKAVLLLHDDTELYPHNDADGCPPPADVLNNEVDLSAAAAGLVGDPGWTGWNGPYISSALDPWGRPYFFDSDYYCTAGAIGCNGVTHNGAPGASAIISCGPDRRIGDDTDNSQPDNGLACAYNDDNIVHVICWAP